jgi:uncharacterized protein YlxW (UPF0749 family)
VSITVEDPGGQVEWDAVLDLVQELRDAGAEAIEINDSVRVVAQTSFEDGEGGVVVDGTQLSPPYTIEAIGDEQTLSTALTIRGGFAQDIEDPVAVGGDVAIEETSNVEVATLAELQEPEYAEPVEPE